ncbi:hypothetical protein [Luteolibacter sp. LG18]|uniref:hypothetical protein n=1 Tax=Luteolibacter sp. LG18 TaxID=2819286 RepID=UPI002B304C19|nr:hypothetical protein llg_31310 [Luteolibacter sp. LG18]
MPIQDTFRLAPFLPAFLPLVAAADPVVTISPYKHLQVYESGATGFTWYWGHLRSAPNRDEVLHWLFQDLNIDYVRIGLEPCEPANDNDDPRSIDWSKLKFNPPNESNEWVCHQAKPLNPRLKVIAYGHAFPTWLRVNGKEPDFSNRNFHAEYAEWIFANLVNLKRAEGMNCDILDLCNEPDYKGIGKDQAAGIFENVVPLLRAWVNDRTRNPWGVTMPKIMAPSCLSATVTREWLSDWKGKRSIWSNIDIVSTHQYGGGFEARNYAEVNALRGDRPFFQSEMHCGHSTVLNNPHQLPDDKVEDQLEAALTLGRLFSVAVGNGVSVYDYYMGVSPQESPTSLVHSPHGKPATRRKVYFAFKQLSSMQTRGSNVVATRITDASPGCDVIAYHSGIERKAWITVTSSDNSGQGMTLRLLDKNGSALPIQTVNIYETSASRNAERVATEAPPRSADYKTDLPAQCLRTYEVTW